MNRTRLKVCCISSIEEARMAVAAGADAVGLVGRMPSGPGVIGDETIRAIALAIPPPVAAFLLTSETDAAGIIEHHARTHTGVIQIVDHIDLANYAAIRAALPAVKLVQVVHIEGEGSIGYALDAAKVADAILLDSGNPSAGGATGKCPDDRNDLQNFTNDLQKIILMKMGGKGSQREADEARASLEQRYERKLGGTGAVHDWSISRRIVEKSPVPVFLAGGINPGNVAQAISEVRPYGIDLCSGVRSGGKLDPAKLDALVRAIAKADSAL